MSPITRLPLPLRGVPARLGGVLAIGLGFGTWALWSDAAPAPAPAALALDGKHVDRLAFNGDETHIPVRESRIYDTVAMFAQPQAEPRAWSESPVPATIAEAGIRPIAARPAPAVRVAARGDIAPKPARVASLPPIRVVTAVAPERAEAFNLLGWDVPGTQHLPTRAEAARALDTVGAGAEALGTGTYRVVSKAASAVGSGVAGAGGALAERLGLN